MKIYTFPNFGTRETEAKSEGKPKNPEKKAL